MTTQTYPVNNIGRELIPFRIRNQSGHRGQLYIHLVGTTKPKSSENNCYYLIDLQGNVALCKPTGGRETSYSMKISDDVTLQLPRLSGMRIYFSFDNPLHVVVGDNGIPSSPAGWAKGSDYDTLFDWIELTWEQNSTDTTLGANATQVDMFGLPVSIELSGNEAEGKPVTVNGGFTRDSVRDKILADLKGVPGPWSKLIVTNPTTGFDLRALSPYHGMELDLFPRDELQDYIDKVWDHYKTNALTASAEGVTFVGHVDKNDVLVFTAPGDEIRFAKPSSFIVYTSGPMPAVPSGKAGVIQTCLQAAFLRSTLLTSPKLPECDSSLYYKSAPINHYAKIIHSYATDNGAYAFGFDDVCSKSSFIIVHNPVSAGVTLRGF
jgi:hypothetical protein